MPGMNMMNHPHPDDQDAAMARADLYKTANYSFKLFKMIQDGDQLEGWVQAKITKAADYVASVYHYLEYEMKFSEYGSKIENSDMYTEAVRKEFKKKLTEAKVKLEKLKEKNQKDLDETFDDKAKVGDKKKTRTGELEKTSTGVKHNNTSYKDDGESEQKSGKGKASHAKGQSAAEKKSQSPKLKQSPKSAKTWGMKDSEKFDNRDGAPAKPKKEKEAELDESLKGGQKKLDVNKNGKLEKDDFAKLRAGKVKEAKEEKFDALKHVKNPTKGEKEAAKDVKRGSYADRAAMLKSAEADGRLKEAAKQNWNNVKETQAYIAEKSAVQKKDKPTKGNDVADEGNEFSGELAKAKASGAKEFKVDGKTYPVNESADLTRIKQFLTRLNG